MTLKDKLEVERKKLYAEMEKLEQVKAKVDIKISELDDVFSQLGAQLDKGCQ